MRLSQDEKNVIDKYLYLYRQWERLRDTCNEEAEWIAKRYGFRSSSDFSDLAELGTQIDKTSTGEGEQERILKHKERVMQGQKDYAEILGRRIIRVDRAMEGIEPLYRKLVEERYFERNEMKDCIRKIDGMSKKKYVTGIREIRASMARYVLGVFAPFSD